MFANITIKWTLVAFVFFLIGLIVAIVALKKYKTDKEQLGDDIKLPPHIVRIVLAFVFLIFSQICLILGK